MPRTAHSDAYARVIDGLVALRKRHGVSQVTLAHRLGKTQQFISYVETRRRRIDIVEWLTIVRAIGADPAQAFRTALVNVPYDHTI